MKNFLDLHVHSKYSRACSDKLTLANLDAVCRVKGLDVIATGDFTYPLWFKNIENELEEIDGGGLYKLKTHPGLRPPLPRGESAKEVKFILSTEVALIYKDGGPHARRIHLVIHAPNIAAAKKLNECLDKKFNIRSDGRPILGMSAPDMVKLCLSIHPQFLIYPAHIWTPWFSVFGSKSGFDKMEDCFREQTKNIFAYETGLSSDPEMNWRLSALDNFTMLSNSDAHSLANVGRECNIMDLEKNTYSEVYGIIKANDTKRLLGTIEFYPEEGMYHLDGHDFCDVSLTPDETKKNKGICPKCKKPLVIGVLNRVEELANRVAGVKPKNARPYIKLVELDKIIAEAFNVKSRHSKKVQAEYDKLIKKFGSELFILTDLKLEELSAWTSSAIVEGIRRVRAGELCIKPGFDGRYGKVRIFTDQETAGGKLQNKFFK